MHPRIEIMCMVLWWDSHVLTWFRSTTWSERLFFTQLQPGLRSNTDISLIVSISEPTSFLRSPLTSCHFSKKKGPSRVWTSSGKCSNTSCSNHQCPLIEMKDHSGRFTCITLPSATEWNQKRFAKKGISTSESWATSNQATGQALSKRPCQNCRMYCKLDRTKYTHYTGLLGSLCLSGVRFEFHVLAMVSCIRRSRLVLKSGVASIST